MGKFLRYNLFRTALTVVGLAVWTAGVCAGPQAESARPKNETGLSRDQRSGRSIKPRPAESASLPPAFGAKLSSALLPLPSSSFLRPEPPAPVRVRLLFAGDLMQHLPQVAAARRAEGFDYSRSFGCVRPHFTNADLAVVNLETTLTATNDYTGYPLFRSPTALADAMRELGVGVAVLANNHCCDGGAEGVRTTIGALDRCGIRHTGLFADSLDHAANHPLRMDIKGIRFALLNYTYGTNGMPVPRGMRVNVIDTVRMAADLALARRDTADCVVVCIHWGDEYQPVENAQQRRLAGFLRRHGADIIVGSHPHVVQPWEVSPDHIVLYSLGNFVSNQRKRRTDGGLLAAIEVVRLPGGRMRYTLEVVPVWVSMSGYRILPPEAADTMHLPEAYTLFREDIEAISRSAGTN